jgi:hypothetical protein
MIAVPIALLRPLVFIMENTLPGSPVSSSLLDLLAVPNTAPDNALLNYFGIEPMPFSGENIAYLRETSIGQALKKFLTNATVN